MRLNHFIFTEKKSMREKEFSFFMLSNCQGSAFLWKNLSGKSLQSQFRRFRDENIVYLAFIFVLNKDQLGWSTASYSA